jgi:cytochrome b pre-mRNA-processing protein 3
MLRALKQFLSSDSYAREAHEAYVQLVIQSRRAEFYQSLGVEDTVDGRFDVILLHMFLVIHRLRGETDEAAGQFIRAISEVFFADMDRSLREMGVGDTGVSHRIKKMAQAFYGRMQMYEQNVRSADAFRDSLKRNLYRGRDVDAAVLTRAGDYALRNIEHLKNQPLESIISGHVSFLNF